MKRFLFLLLVLLFLCPNTWAINELVASGTCTQANMRISAVNGTAFVDFGAADVLTTKLGNLLVIKDSLGHSIQGWIKAAGSSETKAAAKSVTGITKANPGVLTLAAGHGYANLNLVYFSGLTEMTDLNTKYRVLTGNSGDTFQIGDTSAYAAAESTGGNCIQLITTPSATGVTIVSTKGGSTYNFSAKDSAFNYNDSSGYTYYIYKTPAVLIANGTFTAANARNSFDATTAFCEASGLDLSPYAGTDAGSTPYLIVLEDASGDVAWGFGGAVGGGEDLAAAANVSNCVNGTSSAAYETFDGVSPTAFHAVNSSVGTKRGGTADEIVVAVGELWKISLSATLTSGTAPILNFRASLGGSNLGVTTFGTVIAGANTGYTTTTIATTGLVELTSTTTNEFTIASLAAQKVTDCAVTGLHIFTARNGTTRGWKTIGSTFGYNDAMKYRVYYLGS